MEETLKGKYAKARRGWKELKDQIVAEIERRSCQRSDNPLANPHSEHSELTGSPSKGRQTIAPGN